MRSLDMRVRSHTLSLSCKFVPHSSAVTGCLAERWLAFLQCYVVYLPVDLGIGKTTGGGDVWEKQLIVSRSRITSVSPVPRTPSSRQHDTGENFGHRMDPQL
jgi:hypothetical protein